MWHNPMELLRDMALFVAVAKAKSFTRAAEALSLPLSSLSRRIAALEKAIGLQLLNRTTRKIELTEAGAIYFARCQQIVEAAHIAHEQLQTFAATPRGRLRVSMPVNFGTFFLAPLIANFAERYPDVSFDLDLSPRRVDLLSEPFDLAIRVGELPDSSLIVRRLALVPAGLYAAPSYLERFGTPAHPLELPQHTCIQLLSSAGSAVWKLRRAEETVEVDVAGRFAINNIGMVQRLAVLGLGIGAIDATIANESVQAGRLQQVLPTWQLPPVPIFALTATRLLPAKTALLIDFLAEQLQ